MLHARRRRIWIRWCASCSTIDPVPRRQRSTFGSYLTMARQLLPQPRLPLIESPAMTSSNRTSGAPARSPSRRLITHQLWYYDHLLLIAPPNEMKTPPAVSHRYRRTRSNSTYEEWNRKRLTSNPSTRYGYTCSGPHGRKPTSAAAWPFSAPAAPSTAPDAGS